MNRNIATLASASVLVLASGVAVAKDAPKAYMLKDKVETCKAGYDRVEVESIKVAANGAVALKYKGHAAMAPVPKKFAAEYASLKSGDIQCLPGSKD